MKNYLVALLIAALFLTSCSSEMTLKEQIIKDLSTKLPSGTCKDYPKGVLISNITVGEIVAIGIGGMTDVSYELDCEIDGVKKHKKGAMLYLKEGAKYKLAVMGCESDLTNK